MSMVIPFRDARYMTIASGGPAARLPCRHPGGATVTRLLRVELDDELFLDLGVDLGPDRQRVDQDAHLVRDHLEPGRHNALADLGLRHEERGQLPGLGDDLDDVVLADPVGRDVHLRPVHREVPVPHQLAGHVAALGEAGAEHDVVQPPLEQLEHGLAGPAVLAGRLFVVPMELALEDAVDAAGLLLLPDLLEVVAFLRPVPAVLTRRVGPDLDRALRRVAPGALQEELGLLPAAELAVRACVSSHLCRCLLSGTVRPGAASAAGSHCAGRGSCPGSNRPPGRSPAATGWRSPGPSPGP